MPTAAAAASGPSIEGGACPAGPRILSKEDLVDYRAVQRTFDGAYARTALGQLCYAVVILRLFQERFFWLGLVYALFAIGFIPIAVYRYRNAVQNDDSFMELQGGVQSHDAPPTATATATGAAASAVDGSLQAAAEGHHVPTHPHPHPQQQQQQTAAMVVQPRRGLFVKSFVTAGSVVALATVVVATFEVALLILLFLI